MAKEQMKKKCLCFTCGKKDYRAFECKKNTEIQTQDKKVQVIQAETDVNQKCTCG